MKKILALLLVLALSISVCSIAAADEPVHLSLFISGDSTRLNDENPMHAFILEKSGVYLDIQIPIGDADEKLNMLLTGDQYPDLQPLLRHFPDHFESGIKDQYTDSKLDTLKRMSNPGNLKETFKKH